MGVGALAGTKLYIGDSNTTPSPDTYVEVGNISNLGAYGGTNFNKIAVESIGSGYTRQIKGTELAPVMDLTLNRDDTDAGQLALKSASGDRNLLWNFKVVENDGPPENAIATTTTFKGRVFGFTTNAGGVNDLKRVTTSVEVEPDSIVFTAAHP